ncbi:MAG: pyridoxal phosphate-dependent aminotransferase [Chitinispirillales bacterium]|nr:pyridoxal phosphate-dependent aminotransferase [Chitinispirillales bacterium]
MSDVNFNFDKPVDRQTAYSYSIKHDPVSRKKPTDVLPMWVADMDFPAPPCVLDVLTDRVKHGVFGYSEPDARYFSAVQGWFEKRFDWHINSEWLSITPGVVNAIYIAIRALTKPDGGILIQQPVYHPFESAVKDTKRKLLVNRLVYGGDGRYGIDFADFEEKAGQAEMFILCNPHNPVGRVWTREELLRMGEICLRHGVTVISDEIHQDFIYKGYKHLVFSGLDKRFAAITVTCTAPSKTFNLAGLQLANIVISNKSMRNAFEREYASIGLSQPPLMGLAACQAAYEGGAEWLEQLIDYLAGNMSLIDDFLRTHVPKVKLIKPEGTYLAWLDCAGLGLSVCGLNDFITNKAKLWLNNGPMFGVGGEGFQRMNAACQRTVVNTALERLKAAVKNL